jgi:hypothetical protein
VDTVTHVDIVHYENQENRRKQPRVEFAHKPLFGGQTFGGSYFRQRIDFGRRELSAFFVYDGRFLFSHFYSDVGRKW